MPYGLFSLELQGLVEYRSLGAGVVGVDAVDVAVGAAAAAGVAAVGVAAGAATAGAALVVSTGVETLVSELDAGVSEETLTLVSGLEMFWVAKLCAILGIVGI